MRRIIAILFLFAIVFLFAATLLPSHQMPKNGIDVAAPGASPNVVVYSTYNVPEELFVPVNSSGIDVYPDWHISLYGSGSYAFSVNGKVVDTGYISIDGNLSYTWNVPGGTHINATLKFAGASYYFHDTIIGPLSRQVIQSVSVYSTYPGQDQELSVSPGQSGALMYPHWTLTMESTQNVSYSIYENSQEILSGSVIGTKTVEFNVTGNETSVSVGLGSHVFKFPDELISTIPIQKYYGPKPPTLQYTVAEYEYGIIKAFIASLFAVVIASFSVRKWVVEHEKREVRLI